MRRVTRDDVTKAVGRADDVTIAQIIGTGATVDELAEAQAWVANDEPLLNAGKPLANGRVRELIDILAEFGPDEEDDQEAGPVTRTPPCRASGTGSLMHFPLRNRRLELRNLRGVRRLPLKVSTLPSAEMATRSPSHTSPARIISASGSGT
jgi:hypothetical protein